MGVDEAMGVVYKKTVAPQPAHTMCAQIVLQKLKDQSSSLHEKLGEGLEAYTSFATEEGIVDPPDALGFTLTTTEINILEQRWRWKGISIQQVHAVLLPGLHISYR